MARSNQFWVCHGKNDTEHINYSVVLEDDYVQDLSGINEHTVDLCIKTRNKIFSLSNADRRKIYRDMYIDYGDPHIVKVKRLEKKKGNKY